MTALLLLTVVVLPALAGALCAARPPHGAHAPGRLGATAAGLAFAGSVALAVAVLRAGSVSAVVAGDGGRALVGLAADRLSVVLLLVVFGVSAVVQHFAGRYLSGDPRQARLIAAAGITTSAVAIVVTAATLAVLVVAWLVTGAGLLTMLGHRADLPAARLGLRRAAVAFAIGDLALVGAAVLVWSTVGEVDLRSLAAQVPSLAAARISLFGASVGVGAPIACLLVVAAMARSAQLPLQRWLPATLAAPTPVSALLHAGLVNAGGVLLVRLGPIFGLSPLATGLAFATGAATAVYGTVLMLARPDVKGALAHSTMGQMGYMMLACSLGAFAAVVFHLVAHGMYKAALFLGADSVVHTGKWRASVPHAAAGGIRRPRGPRTAGAALLPAAALTGAVTTFASAAVHQPGAIVLLAFAWASAARAGLRWLGAAPGRAVAGLIGIAGCCLAYAALLAGADSFLSPALGGAAHPVAAWAALVPALVLAAVMLAARRTDSSSWRALYVRALDAGHVAAHPRLPEPTGRTIRPVPAPSRVPSVTA